MNDVKAPYRKPPPGASRSPRNTAVIALVVFVLAAVPGGYLGYRAYHFAWTDARFCFACHIHDYAVNEWKRSAHGDVTTCHDCHHMPLLHYTYVGARALFNRPSYPDDLENPPSIPDELCMQCHVRGAIQRSSWTLPFQYDSLKRIPAIDVTAGHRWHTASKTIEPVARILLDDSAKEAVKRGFEPRHELNCWRCHGSEGNRYHQYRATNVNCRSCHADSHLKDQLKFTGTDCLLCHINAFVLDHRNPASRALKLEEVDGKGSKDIQTLLDELKEKYPITEMVLE